MGGPRIEIGTRKIVYLVQISDQIIIYVICTYTYIFDNFNKQGHSDWLKTDWFKMSEHHKWLVLVNRILHIVGNRSKAGLGDVPTRSPANDIPYGL